ncbi:MAG: hypothetical protein PHN89_00525 [Candidatus Pacebacteria bacterium]|nr:hypothetical protein [Candidatus Paceibacterota bacterium]
MILPLFIPMPVLDAGHQLGNQLMIAGYLFQRFLVNLRVFSQDFVFLDSDQFLNGIVAWSSAYFDDFSFPEYSRFKLMVIAFVSFVAPFIAYPAKEHLNRLRALCQGANFIISYFFCQ